MVLDEINVSKLLNDYNTTIKNFYAWQIRFKCHRWKLQSYNFFYNEFVELKEKLFVLM